MGDGLINWNELSTDEQERLQQEMLAVPNSLPDDRISIAPRQLDTNDEAISFPDEQGQENK